MKFAKVTRETKVWIGQKWRDPSRPELTTSVIRLTPDAIGFRDDYGDDYGKNASTNWGILVHVIKNAIDLGWEASLQEDAIPPSGREYAFFAEVPSGHCACNIPKERCKYHA